MGDFHDKLWDALNKQVQIWQRELHAGTPLGPVPLVPGTAEPHQLIEKPIRYMASFWDTHCGTLAPLSTTTHRTWKAEWTIPW